MKKLVHPIALLISAALYPAMGIAASKNTLPQWGVSYTKGLKDSPNTDSTFFVFSQWIVGQLKPCSCSMASYGGIEAREAQLNNLKKQYKNLIVLDAGNTFFPDEEVLTKYKDNFKNANYFKNAQTLVKTYEKWGVDSVALGRYEHEKDYAQILKLFSTHPKFSILSNSPQTSLFAQKHKDFPIGRSGIRLIPMGHTELKNNAVEAIFKELHPTYANVFIGDASYKDLTSISEKNKIQGEYLYIGSGDEINLESPVKAGSFMQVIGAYRNQNWMLLKVSIDAEKKKLWTDTTSVQSWSKKPKKT